MASTSDLAQMRMMLAQNQLPQLNVQPVNDIGGGIAMGVGNIANALMARRERTLQQQALESLMAQQQEQAQAQAAAESAQAQRILSALGLSGDLAGADASTINAVYKSQADSQADYTKAKKEETQNAVLWKSNYDAAYAALGRDKLLDEPTRKALATATANDATLNKNAVLSSSGLGAVSKGSLLTGALYGLTGGKPELLNDGQAAPDLRTAAGNYGIGLVDGLDSRVRAIDADQKQVNLQYTAPLNNSLIESRDAATVGQGLTNQNTAMENQQLQDRMTNAQNYLNGGVTAGEFLLGAGALSDNPVGTFNTLTTNKNLYNKRNGIAPNSALDFPAPTTTVAPAPMNPASAPAKTKAAPKKAQASPIEMQAQMYDASQYSPAQKAELQKIIMQQSSGMVGVKPEDRVGAWLMGIPGLIQKNSIESKARTSAPTNYKEQRPWWMR